MAEWYRIVFISQTALIGIEPIWVYIPVFIAKHGIPTLTPAPDTYLTLLTVASRNGKGDWVLFHRFLYLLL